jgi:hypothetical protein
VDRSAKDIAPASAALAFHHLGLAVAFPEEAFRYLASLGYMAGNAAFDPIQRVNLAMRHHPMMPDVEVIWPGDGPSPIDKLIRRSGAMIYHLCYACPDADQALDALSASGVEIVPVSAPAPAILFGGQKVSFHHVSGFGLIELLETGTERQATIA